MMEDLIKLDKLLEAFWQGFFEDFPVWDLIGMLVGTAILALVLLAI